MDLDMENVNFSDSELISHVKNVLKSALEDHNVLQSPLEGHNDNYTQLVATITMHYDKSKNHGKNMTIKQELDMHASLVAGLKGLSGAVSCIDNVHHQSLLEAIFGMSFWSYGNNVMVMDVLHELILSLATSKGEYVETCLNMLVTNFVPPIGFVGLERKRVVMDRVHCLLKDIADLVPLSPMILERIVRERMAHERSKADMVMYVENMLRLENGDLGELVRSSMFGLILDTLIDLDSKIVVDDGVQEDDFTKGVFDNMELGEFEGIGDVGEDEIDGMRELLIQKLFGEDKIESALKLDKLLVLIFEHLDLCYVSGRLSEVFEILFHSFETIVLPVYKSKFTQFVMFYACSLDPENCGKNFARMLLDIFTGSMHPGLWKKCAVAYLASYLSRAKFVSASFVAIILGVLVKWCSDYCKNQDREIIINPKMHKLFYAGCQAIMYVLCFRMRSMVQIPHLKSQMCLMNLEEIMSHPLKPLKECLPSIVEEFLHVVREVRLFTVPEMDEFDDSTVESLDMFFPFDPCLLRRSDSFIRPNFVYWWMVKSTLDDAEEAEEDSSDDDGSELHEFGDSFDQMSITPNEFAARNFFMQMPSKIRPSTSPEWM